MNLNTLTPYYKVIADAQSRALDGTCYVVRGCAPTANGAGLRVDVAAGDSVEAGTPHSGYAGGNVTCTAASSAASLLYRRDIVYRSSAGTLTVTAGTAALLTSTTPVPPALPASATLLSVVFIAPGQTTLAAIDVEDVRQTRRNDVQALNVKVFGATGDGTTDDTAAIQAALDAVPTGGCRVYIPAGTYKTTASLTITKAGTWIIGDGMVASLISRDATGNPATDTVIFSAVTATPSGMRDIGVNQLGGSITNSSGVSVLNANSVFLDHVFVNGFLHGIKFTGSGDCVAEQCVTEGANTNGYFVTTSDPIRLNNCESYRNGYGFALDTPRSPGGANTHTYPCIVSDCTASEDTSAGFYVNGYTDVTFTGCEVNGGKLNAQNIPVYGFWLTSTYNRINITSPVIAHVRQYGIRCVTGGNGVSITNPTIDAIGDYNPVSAVSMYGILVEASVSCNILGGHLTNLKGYGLSHSGYGTISGVSIIDASLNASATQGLYALEVAPTASTPIYVSSVFLLNNSGPRGTGVRVSNASSVVTFSHVTATGFTTAYDNNGGSGIVRSIFACSWQNSGQCISRFLNSAALNITNSSAGTYVDFGGSFTTAVTTVAGDQVCIRVQGIFQKATGGSAAIVVDRGGTKLPAAAGGSSVVTGLITSYIPFAFEYWDSPSAGTYTYKPQLYTSDGNTASAGLGANCQFAVEVWR